MDRLRTLLLARTRIVVLDQDSVASAATRPSRDVDLDRFEDELAQLGFVMSLDLAMTVRRLPHQAIQDLKAWIFATLAGAVGPQRPVVPLYRGFRDGTPPDTRALYLRRVLSWLFTKPEQPCPWCAQIKTVGALDPCGHLVCRSCWDGGKFAGCPICHRRIAVGDPFLLPAPDAQSERVTHEDAQLRLIDLAFDALYVARERFERLMARTTPLSSSDREEVEALIDVLGPRSAIWLPPSIAVKETMAVAIARLWIGSPDRAAMVKATQGHLRTATDVLRVAVTLMGADPALVEPMRLRSLPRALRRSVLEALDRLPPEPLLEDIRRHAGLWKRVGERLHPFEFAAKLPTAAIAFAVIRQTDLAKATFGPDLIARTAALRGIGAPPGTKHFVVSPWAGAIEAALRAKDAKQAAERLAERPAELLRRVDHLLRVSGTDDAAVGAVIAAVRGAIPHGTPSTLLMLAAHARPRDSRRAESIQTIVDAVRTELLARAAKRKPFARAVIDRALVDQPVGTGARPRLWGVAAIHAAARANVIYVRERDGTVSTVRRRDGESTLQRLARVYDNPAHDSQLSKIPLADAPTWVALVEHGELVLPKGSAGLILEPGRGAEGVARLSAADLVAELTAKS